jgi:hypothetical protein
MTSMTEMHLELKGKMGFSAFLFFGAAGCGYAFYAEYDNDKSDNDYIIMWVVFSFLFLAAAVYHTYKTIKEYF